jgi:hypothetical protein
MAVDPTVFRAMVDGFFAGPGEFTSRSGLGNIIRVLAEAVVESLQGQVAEVTQPGASPFAVVFADIGLTDMVNANYKVFVGGDTNAKLLQSSRTTTGFTLIGGNATDVIHLIVTGGLETDTVT